MKKWLKAPALHMLALGALLFVVTDLRGGALLPRKKRIEIPAHRLAQMAQEFVADTGLHEYEEARPLPVEAVRMEVEQAVLQKLADDWLKLRLRELRADFDIVVPGRVS